MQLKEQDKIFVPSVIQGEVYVWRDGIDGDQFWFGVKTTTHRYVAWVSLFADSFYDLFDRDTYEFVKTIPAGGPPVKIKLSMQWANRDK